MWLQLALVISLAAFSNAFFQNDGFNFGCTPYLALHYINITVTARGGFWENVPTEYSASIEKLITSTPSQIPSGGHSLLLQEKTPTLPKYTSLSQGEMSSEYFVAHQPFHYRSFIEIKKRYSKEMFVEFGLREPVVSVEYDPLSERLFIMDGKPGRIVACSSQLDTVKCVIVLEMKGDAIWMSLAPKLGKIFYTDGKKVYITDMSGLKTEAVCERQCTAEIGDKKITSVEYDRAIGFLYFQLQDGEIYNLFGFEADACSVARVDGLNEIGLGFQVYNNSMYFVSAEYKLNKAVLKNDMFDKTSMSVHTAEFDYSFDKTLYTSKGGPRVNMVIEEACEYQEPHGSTAWYDQRPCSARYGSFTGVSSNSRVKCDDKSICLPARIRQLETETMVPQCVCLEKGDFGETSSGGNCTGGGNYIAAYNPLEKKLWHYKLNSIGKKLFPDDYPHHMSSKLPENCTEFIVPGKLREQFFCFNGSALVEENFWHRTGQRVVVDMPYVRLSALQFHPASNLLIWLDRSRKLIQAADVTTRHIVTLASRTEATDFVISKDGCMLYTEPQKGPATEHLSTIYRCDNLLMKDCKELASYVQLSYDITGLKVDLITNTLSYFISDFTFSVLRSITLVTMPLDEEKPQPHMVPIPSNDWDTPDDWAIHNKYLITVAENRVHIWKLVQERRDSEVLHSTRELQLTKPLLIWFGGVHIDTICSQARCKHACVILDGAAQCLCAPTFRLDADGTSCSPRPIDAPCDTVSEFPCHATNTCIPLVQLVDNIAQCPDSDDEVPRSAIKWGVDTQYIEKLHKCPRHFVPCDGFDDCDNGFDENFCPDIRHRWHSFLNQNRVLVMNDTSISQCLGDGTLSAICDSHVLLINEFYSLLPSDQIFHDVIAMGHDRILLVTGAREDSNTFNVVCAHVKAFMDESSGTTKVSLVDSTLALQLPTISASDLDAKHYVGILSVDETTDNLFIFNPERKILTVCPITGNKICVVLNGTKLPTDIQSIFIHPKNHGIYMKDSSSKSLTVVGQNDLQNYFPSSADEQYVGNVVKSMAYDAEYDRMWLLYNAQLHSYAFSRGYAVQRDSLHKHKVLEEAAEIRQLLVHDRMGVAIHGNSATTVRLFDFTFATPAEKRVELHGQSYSGIHKVVIVPGRNTGVTKNKCVHCRSVCLLNVSEKQTCMCGHQDAHDCEKPKYGIALAICTPSQVECSEDLSCEVESANMCGDHGSCERNADLGYICSCDWGYAGNRCQYYYADSPAAPLIAAICIIIFLILLVPIVFLIILRSQHPIALRLKGHIAGMISKKPTKKVRSISQQRLHEADLDRNRHIHAMEAKIHLVVGADGHHNPLAAHYQHTTPPQSPQKGQPEAHAFPADSLMSPAESLMSSVPPTPYSSTSSHYESTRPATDAIYMTTNPTNC